MCRANTHFIGYILMPSVISQLSPWPTNWLEVAHHPPSSFFETVYFIFITCICGEDECVHLTECRCLEAADPWSWVTGGCELPDVGAGNRNKSSKCPWPLSCLSSLWPQLLYPCLSQIIPWLAVARLSFQKAPLQTSFLTVWNKPVIFPLLLYLHAFYLLMYKPAA